MTKSNDKQESIAKIYSETLKRYFVHANKRPRTREDEVEAAWAMRDIIELEKEIHENDSPEM